MSTMHVLLDCHVANNDQQSAVACSIASSHEDLHEKTSISSRADPNSQSVVPKTCHKERISVWNSDQQPKFITFQKILPTIVDCWASKSSTPLSNVFSWTDPSQPSDQFWHSSRNSSRMFHSSRCSETILRSSRSSGHFSKFSKTFLIRHNLRITFPIFSLESDETCHVLKTLHSIHSS